MDFSNLLWIILVLCVGSLELVKSSPGRISSGATPAGLLAGRSVPFLTRVLLLLYCFFGAQKFPLLESPEDLEASVILVHLFAGIMSGKGGSGINPGMLGGIFKSVMGGGDQGDDEKGNPK